MYDYYRVRFREILPPRRPIRATHSSIGIAPIPPWPLRILRAVSSLFMIAGLLSSISIGRSQPEQAPAFFAFAIYSLPITAPFVIGFHAARPWTRPLVLIWPILLGEMARRTDNPSWAI